MARALQKLGAAVGRSTGVAGLAGQFVDLHDVTLHRLAAMALEHGVSEANVKRALRAEAKAQKIQALVTLVFPFVPSVQVLRIVAGDRAVDRAKAAHEKAAMRR